jgi:tetratricopeptide (TPR) repeat protein
MRLLNHVVGLGLALLALLPGGRAALTPRADALMYRRGASSMEEAVTLYTKALAQEPDSTDLQLKLADALNGVMRARTNGNTIVIDSMLDTPANKAIWAKLGPRALELATAVQRARPNDAHVAAVYADAFMYSCSSKGIIKQAMSGAATVFKSNAQRLTNLDRTYDSALGHALLGCFYALAPWPYGSLDKAAEVMDEAAKLAPSRRNLYFVGVVAYKRKQWSKAADHFRKAQAAKPGSITESDFADFVLAESKRALKLAEAELMRCSTK